MKVVPLTPPVIALEEHVFLVNVRWGPAVPQETRSPQPSQREHQMTLKATVVFKAKYFLYLNVNQLIRLVFVLRKNDISKY